MSGTANSEVLTTESVKPVHDSEEVKFPPFPDPKDDDFEDDISEEEKTFYKEKFPDINTLKTLKLHCTACDRHLGCAPRNESRMRSHPMLRTLMCNTCHTFYNSGEFEKGEDGSELYCRWCGQGGQVYCCSDCPHVFCAKCIKRNLGVSKIKEIENTDDWKCFKCVPKCLWELRATCWAVLRFCDLRNKLTYSTQDPDLKEAYQKSLAIDESTCCKHKVAKRKVREDSRKSAQKALDKITTDLEDTIKKEMATSAVISKIPPTIQVKKFASINLDNSPKKGVKRPASPSKMKLEKLSNKPQPNKFYSPAPHLMNKKIKINNMINPIRVQGGNPIRYQGANTIRVQPANQNMPFFRAIKPQPYAMPMLLNNALNNGYNNSGSYNNTSSFNNSSSFNSSFNNSNSFNNSGYNPMLTADNINLSLEELTQGLDMAAVAAMASNNMNSNDDVVCTPDFPLEPMCEVTEDNNDDDVECISGPKVSKSNPPSQLTPRLSNTIPDLSPENIIQMTDNDVTVNPQTGGLKFRVDPQTLSSNKMYRLPDGRIFAINSNPNMPGGYSATIVAVSENSKKPKSQAKGATFAARLSAVTPAVKSKTHKSSILSKAITVTSRPTRSSSRSRNQSNADSESKESDLNTDENRVSDLKVPIEWYRYNLIDAVDSLEYSLTRLKKLKKEATTTYLRTRTVDEMRSLHKVLDRVLNTSCTRFEEIKVNLNKGLKTYIANKSGMGTTISDDDDVEILNDEQNDDPIFIDENSVDSVQETTEKPQQVDLTQSFGELNDSGEKSIDHTDNTEKDPFADVNGSENEIINGEKDNNDIDDPGETVVDKDKDTEEDSKKHSGEEDNDETAIVEQSLGLNIDNVIKSDLVDKEVTSESSAKCSEENNAVSNESETGMDVDEKANTIECDNDNKVPVENKEALASENIDESENEGDMETEKDSPVTEKDSAVTENDSAVTENETEKVIENSNDNRSQDTEMTEEMIENLLSDHLDDAVNENLDLLDIPELQDP